VLLFYSRPWKDVATNLANSQQVRMVATSYLAGYALIKSGTPEQREALRELTERSLLSIRRIGEKESVPQREAEPSPEA
jgi:hypothetical protein